MSPSFTFCLVKLLNSRSLLTHYRPPNRYKLSILAGDETGDTNFILFGCIAQRLIKKSVETLIAGNPVGFIPNEITKLLEKVFQMECSLLRVHNIVWKCLLSS